MTGWRLAGRSVVAVIGLAAIATIVYSGLVAWAWHRFGPAPHSVPPSDDPLLDAFVPIFDIVERHAIDVDAPAPVVLQAAREIELTSFPAVRTIIRAREILLGATGEMAPRPKGLVAEMQALGWGVLRASPGEIVLGAVTQPWKANVSFTALPPEVFAQFREPGYVKIAWTLRADPLSDRRARFRTETRALSLGSDARRRFRRYWAFVSPGIVLIRLVMLRPLKARAEFLARGLDRLLR